MTADRSRRPQLTVRGWQFLVLLSMGLLVLLGAVAGAALLSRTDEMTREMTDTILPARVAAADLQAALRDQETGLRGYVISADRQFLAPYYDGEHDELAAAAEVRRRIGSHPDLIADLDAIEKASAAWRATYADPLIASVAPNTPSLVTSATAERGKAEFDHIRGLFTVQNDDLARARAHAADEIRRVDDWRDRVLVAMVVVFCATATFLGLLTRYAVTLPLQSLAAACRRITQGHFDEAITPPRRPTDVRRMALDVEDMRQRMVEELEASRSARMLLDEQTIELRRSNAELEQFAYVASHDLQEPLRRVASFCQLLEKRYGDKLDERGLEYIGFAVDGAKRMQVLINDLLSFSRVGRVGAVSAEADLEAALDDAVANLATALEESDAEIVRPAQRLPRVVGDPTLLTMLWQNLIGNAVKFRRADQPPHIVIECKQRAGEWFVTVTDNGIGIDKEYVDKVFVIFQRLHGRDRYSGTGLGLALCKKIVEHHGGTIRIDASYDGGTRFEFTLPVSESSESSDADARRVATRQGAPE
ncbi:sensor histidine kinase [Mycobacterium conspicuum]|uniref:histidine kinase n=1 Tax=Mycobacterium conspicuum TaxID=44010 RepID=A0A1X1TP38_9MYCO|nr:sensor histidine kinase [Mycobacterium conspicuum]ORV46228.1 histidine kinase [Mycobacterium conspicuum]BBZ37795.1 histidine kinase [Mycobacterium conspicuum]